MKIIMCLVAFYINIQVNKYTYFWFSNKQDINDKIYIKPREIIIYYIAYRLRGCIYYNIYN